MKKSNRLKSTLAQSSWVTTAWNWFMMFAGRGAEPVLFLSVLYASVKLLPAVHFTPQLDTTVFIAQFVALDIGGLSLNKLANQVARDNPGGASNARKLSVTLIVIMIVGVTMPALTPVLKFLPHSMEVIDTTLLIVRAILAVLYSRVIHNLKTDEEPAPVAFADSWAMVGLAAYLQQDFQQQLSQTIAKLPVPPALESIQSMIDLSLADLSARLERSINLQQIEQHRLLDKVQGVENRKPEVDLEVIIRAMLPQLRATFAGQVKAIVEEVQGHFPEPEPRRQIEARATAKKPEPPAKSQKPEPANVTRFPVKRPEPGPQKEPEARANGNPEERLQSAYEVLVAQSGRVSGRALAKLAHVNRETASKWLGEIQGQSDSDSEPVVESTIEPLAQGQ